MNISLTGSINNLYLTFGHHIIGMANNRNIFNYIILTIDRISVALHNIQYKLINLLLTITGFNLPLLNNISRS